MSRCRESATSPFIVTSAVTLYDRERTMKGKSTARIMSSPPCVVMPTTSYPSDLMLNKSTAISSSSPRVVNL